MYFSLNGTGIPTALNFPDGGFNAETMFPGDWVLCVQNVPAGVTPATVAALITGSPVALPLPWSSTRFKIGYSTLLAGPCTASNF